MPRSTLKRSFSRNAVALAGLVLAFAALGPSAAVAKKGGTDRPIKGSSSGTAVSDAATLAFVMDTTGIVSHLGKTTTRFEGVVTFTGPDSFTLAASSVQVAANGDKLFGTLSGTGTDDHTGKLEGTGVITFTGGTGRFKHASGSATGPFTMVLTSADGTKLTFAASYSLEGTISYKRCRGKHPGPRHR